MAGRRPHVFLRGDGILLALVEEQAAATERVQHAMETTRETEEAADHGREEMFATLGRKMGAVIDAAKRGDLSQRVDETFDDDRLVTLARGVNAVLSEVSSFFDEFQACLGKLEKGDLTRKITTRFQGRFGEVSRSTNASREQAEGVSGVSAAISEMDQMTQQNVSMVESAAAAAKDLVNDADELKRVASTFETGTSSRRSAPRGDKPLSSTKRGAAPIKPAAAKPNATKPNEADADGSWAAAERAGLVRRQLGGILRHAGRRLARYSEIRFEGATAGHARS